LDRLLQAIQLRKLDRLAAAYVVGAWLLVQAASIALPAFEAPSWVLKALILLAVLGFPAVMALGWMGARHLPGTALPHLRRRSAHLAALGVLGVVLVLAAGELVYRLSGAGGRAPSVASASVAQILAPAASSIAVLPFANMTGNPGQDYFSDGISEELLSDLADNPQLRVVARASSFAFKGRNEDVKTIARLLAVRSIVEGSVREAGQHLRIHAELINASSGYDLWSSSFDREMTDALVVQDEIARAIVSALTHKLLPAKRGLNHAPASDPEAYRDYLQAQYELAPRTRAGIEKALTLFQQAIARQPKFVQAYSGLARAYILLQRYRPDQKDIALLAERSVDRALALDPENLDALGLHLDLAMQRLDWSAARTDARRMLMLNPHSQAVLHEMFRYYQLLGFPEEALRAAQGAAQLNRLSIVDLSNVAAANAHLARWEETAKAAQAVLALYPNQPDTLGRLCNAYASLHQLDRSEKIETQLRALHETTTADLCAAHIATGEGNKERARAILDKLAALFPQGGLGALDIGDEYAIAGVYGKAVAWLNRSYELREFVFFTVPYDRAIAPAFFQTPGWKELWARPRVREWQAVHDAVARDLAAKPSG
jgi:adenylate cyclase